MSQPFGEILAHKGWSIAEVAARWGITTRRVRQMMKENTQRQRDSANGLPERYSDD